MRIIIHNFHHSFHHRGRRGHRGYSGGNIFTHSSDTDCLSVFWKKCRNLFYRQLVSAGFGISRFPPAGNRPVNNCPSNQLPSGIVGMEVNQSCFSTNDANLSGKCHEYSCSLFLSGAWGSTGSSGLRKRSGGRCGTDVLQTLFALQYGMVSHPSTGTFTL